jgi:hypothetical protein
MTMTRLAEEIRISLPTVSVSAKRGQKLAFDNDFSLSSLLEPA